jgi:hypothetical protein
MRRWRSAILTACAVAASIGSVAAAPDQEEAFASTGGTVVSWEAPIATITVTIDFIVNDPDADGLSEAVAGLHQQITDYWLTGLDPLKTDCLFFDLVVTMNVLPESAVRKIEIDGHDAIVTTPGHHVVLWGGNGPNAPHPNTYDPYDSDQVANPGEDFVTPFQHELWAVWSGQLVDPEDYAHEFGHLLGLGDDYRRSGLPIPERNGTLMDNGDRIDQNLFDRLRDVIEDAGTELPCSQTWQAKAHVDIDQTLPSGDECRTTGDAEGQLTVAVDGTISGSLAATETEQCTFGFDRTRSDLVLALQGTASDTALTVSHTSGTTAGYLPLGFFSAAGTLDPIPVAITAPGIAHASVTRNMPNDFNITLTLDFTCLTCG